MWVQQRNIIKLSGLIQMNSRTSLSISGTFMISCIFLVIVQNLLVAVGLNRFYIRQECVQWGNKTSFIREVFTTCVGEFTKQLQKQYICYTFNFSNISLTEYIGLLTLEKIQRIWSDDVIIYLCLNFITIFLLPG